MPLMLLFFLLFITELLLLGKENDLFELFKRGLGFDTVEQLCLVLEDYLNFGVLLVFAGVELAAVGIKGLQKSADLERDLLPCFVTAAAYSGSKNMALGVLAGLLVRLAVERSPQIGVVTVRRFPLRVFIVAWYPIAFVLPTLTEVLGMFP